MLSSHLNGAFSFEVRVETVDAVIDHLHTRPKEFRTYYVTSGHFVYRPFSKRRHEFACFVTVGRRNHAPNVKDTAFAVCQQLSVGFRAVGFTISFSKELISTQGGRFNKEQDVWRRRPSRTTLKAKKLLPCSVYFCQTMVDFPQRYELLLSHC